MEEITMKDMVNICKQYGFIYQGSEIYGGLANTWDYGPLGSLLKDNIKNTWKKRFIQERDCAYEVDAAILMHPRVWEASGHVQSFSDPLIDCKNCKMRYRVDNLISEYNPEVDVDAMTEDEMMNYINENHVPCPKCGKSDFTPLREFNLMFKTFQGVTEDTTSTVYLRPETAQGIFVNFKNVLRTTRRKLPMGIGQIGKAFRNEITPGNFTFRTREFEQMELEFFCKPGTDLEWHKYWKEFCENWLLSLGMKKENIRLRDHSKEELVFYSKATTDIEFKFPFGWGEINGTHNRTDFDLSRHQEYSGEKMFVIDEETKEKFIPYIVESTVGADRLTLALLFNSYKKEELENGEIREIMSFHPAVAPYKVAVLPLIKKYHSEAARKIYNSLRKSFPCDYDDSGTIGKRYRREDVMGTPWCITIDDETLNSNLVTIRNRDNMEQIVLNVDDVKNYIKERIEF